MRRKIPISLVLVVSFFLFILVLPKSPTPSPIRTFFTPPARPAPEVIGYNPTQICENAWDNVVNKKNQNPRYFDVKLQPGCWSGFVYLPKAWHTWYNEPVGETTGWWIAVWYSGWREGRGPYNAGQFATVSFNDVPSILRVQGSGTVRFYTNKAPDDPDEATSVGTTPGKPSIDSTPPAPKEPTPAPVEKPFTVPERKLSHVRTEIADPHLCDKPDNVYYAHYSVLAEPHPAGYHDYSNPKFLFDTRHSDEVVNWTNGFTGTVPGCFIVNESGIPEDIRFVQSPGKEIEDNIIQQISGWRYEPGRYDDHPIRVQLGFELIFR